MNVQAALPNFEKALCQIVRQCEEEENRKIGGKPDREWCKAPGKNPEKTNAQELGIAKDKCCERKVNERKRKSTTEFSKQVKTQKWIDLPGGGACCPDVVVGSPPSCDAVYDFKSSCPLTPRSKPRWGTYRTKSGNPRFDGKPQNEVYEFACGKKPKIIHPNSETCKE